MLTSVNNPKVKEIIGIRSRAKVRRETDAFLVEGLRMFLEVPAKMILETYVTESFLKKNDKNPAVFKKLKTLSYVLVTEEVLQKMSDTQSPQGILLVCRCMHYAEEEVLKGDFLLLMEDLQDPGNLGTLFRTAEAAGVKGIVMTKGTADVFNPKVVRSTMGSLLRMPFIYTEDLAKVIDSLKQSGTNVYGAALEGSEEYTKVAYGEKTAILIGNEGAGLSADILSHTTGNIRIPMAGQVESLNASISGAVLLYEVKRQKA